MFRCLCTRFSVGRCCASKNKWLNNPNFFVCAVALISETIILRYFFHLDCGSDWRFFFVTILEPDICDCQITLEQWLKMPPTQISPTSTFQNVQTSASGLFGLLDGYESPTASTFGAPTTPSSAFPYFYSLPDNGSLNAVSNKQFWAISLVFD